MIPTAAEAAAARADFESLMTIPATIVRRSLSSAGTTVESVRGTAVCALSQMSAREAEQFGRDRSVVLTKGRFPAGTQIRAGDAVDALGRRFEVVGVRSPRALHELQTIVVLEEAR